MNTKGVLVVDDVDSDVDLIRAAILPRLPIAVHLTAVRDGQEALELIRNRVFDLVLLSLDLKFPKLDSLDVLRRIRFDFCIKTPVVVLSSVKRPNDVVKAHDLGASGYVKKPAKFDEFKLVFSNLLHHWLILSEVASDTLHT
jgi:CheY-like chemotaxis protein